jgi:hypothetical protein
MAIEDRDVRPRGPVGDFPTWEGLRSDAAELSACELAERNESDEVRQRRLTTVIIGGGATGLEMAGLSPSYCGGLRMPILPLMEAIVVRASDRHCQLPSYLHSATIFSRLLTHTNETELEFSVRARVPRCKIKKKLAHPTRFERVTFAFGAR